jgi:hypothetical protein
LLDFPHIYLIHLYYFARPETFSSVPTLAQSNDFANSFGPILNAASNELICFSNVKVGPFDPCLELVQIHRKHSACIL